MSYIDMLGPEEQAQVAVVNYIQLQYPKILFMHPAQETFTKSKFQRFKNKALGVRPGVPDILIFEDSHIKNDTAYEIKQYHGLAIEMKYGPNKCTAEQVKWLGDLAERGWSTAVCHTSAEAMDVIDWYLGVRKI